MEIFKDNIKMNDGHKNYIKVYDKDGNLLFTKNNIVTFSGRIALMEMINKTDYTTTYSRTYVSEVNGNKYDRKLCYVMVGNGAANLSTPFIIEKPSMLETDISSKLPLIYTEDIGSDAASYANQGTFNSKDCYFAKKIDSSSIEVDSETNKIVTKYTVTLNAPSDTTLYINELGFYLADDSGNGLEMFSKINFSTIEIKNVLSNNYFTSITIEYYVYA